MSGTAPGDASSDARNDKNDAKDAWSDVSERFASWGRLVADRYRERPASAPGDAAGPSGTGTVDDGGRGLDDAARDIGDQLNRVFTALGDTLRDAEAKAQLKDAVRALGDAVSLTVSEATDEIRKRVRPQDASTDRGDDIPPPPT
jgi:hypothetical protein